MTYFQYNHLWNRLIQLINDSVVADAIFETAVPLIAFHCLMVDQFRILAYPLNPIKHTSLDCQIKSKNIALCLRSEN